VAEEAGGSAHAVELRRKELGLPVGDNLPLERRMPRTPPSRVGGFGWTLRMIEDT